MKISDIKDKKLRELAELRHSQSGWVSSDELGAAFMWDRTLEGSEFWNSVDSCSITNLDSKSIYNTIGRVLSYDNTTGELSFTEINKGS